MHTVKLIASGLVLLGIFLLLALWFDGPRAHALALAALLFVPVWLAAAAANLWVGVRRGGYSVAEELPYFVVVFGVPAAVAGWLWWRYAGSAM